MGKIITIFGKTIPFDKMSQEDKNYIWDKFRDDLKSLKELPVELVQTMLFVLVDKENKRETYLPYNEIKEYLENNDSRLRFIEPTDPNYKLEVVMRLLEYNKDKD